MAPRETENNAYAKFWGDNQRALWHVMVFSGVVNCYVQYHAETSFHGFNLFTRLFVYKNKTMTFYWFYLDSCGDQNG